MRRIKQLLQSIVYRFYVPPSRRIAIDRTTSMVTSMFIRAVASTQELEKMSGHNFDEKEYRLIALEFIYVFLFLVDRFAFTLFRQDARHKVCNILFYGMTELAQEDYGKYKGAEIISQGITFRGLHSDILNARTAEYAQYNILSDDVDNSSLELLKFSRAISRHLVEILGNAKEESKAHIVTMNYLKESLRDLPRKLTEVAEVVG